jgi:hypothetical protein
VTADPIVRLGLGGQQAQIQRPEYLEQMVGPQVARCGRWAGERDLHERQRKNLKAVLRLVMAKAHHLHEDLAEAL